MEADLHESIHLFQSTKPVVLVGGGYCTGADLALAGRYSQCFVAADGGANTLLANAITPAAVIGDMDSIEPAVRTLMPATKMHFVAEQESTDFEKCLHHIVAPIILGLGFTGQRIDHQMAALHALVRYPQQRCVLLAEHDVIFLAPPELTVDLPCDSRISLFPMGSVSGHSAGLAWPVDGLDFAPERRIGTSNKTKGSVKLVFSAPLMLVILPRDFLSSALQALREARRHWPVSGG